MESYVYIVECVDGTLYTGWSSRPIQRIAAHNAGKGAKYTRGRRPVKLMYLERMEDKSAGLVREAQIKKLKAEEKRSLIERYAQRSAACWRCLEETQWRTRQRTEKKK